MGVIALGFCLVAGTLAIPAGAGFARIGPSAFPWAVSIALLIVGISLLREALAGGGVANGTEPEASGFEILPFAYISLGLILHLLLVERAGFVVASAVLFVCTARGFGARHWLLTTALGLALAILTFAGFRYGLDLDLPTGPLLRFVQ